MTQVLGHHHFIALHSTDILGSDILECGDPNNQSRPGTGREGDSLFNRPYKYLLALRIRNEIYHEQDRGAVESRAMISRMGVVE